MTKLFEEFCRIAETSDPRPSSFHLCDDSEILQFSAGAFASLKAAGIAHNMIQAENAVRSGNLNIMGVRISIAQCEGRTRFTMHNGTRYRHA